MGSNHVATAELVRLAGTVLVGPVMRVPDFFLVIGIIEGEQQGVHLTQDLFIRNGAFPDPASRASICSCVFPCLTSFTLNLTQRRPDLSIDLRQASCLLGWGAAPRNTDATRRFVFRSRIRSPSFSQNLRPFALDLRRGVRKGDDARETESPTPHLSSSGRVGLTDPKVGSDVSLIVAAFRAGMLTIRIAYSLDGQEV
jgi:hypothetical protein